ncbi:MAG: ferrous iron transport protein B [Nitrospinota bacterium]|nr:ferrous iron transport protein B [Nitrospinota bacterium]
MEKKESPGRKIVIVGPANAGKSILFNKFSRSYSIVSNYSQTTFTAVRKEADFAGGRYEIIDTPGIFSLNVLSDDERVTRDILLEENPELLIFCGDAVNLKQSLVLLSQVLELSIPTAFCLNKIDEAEKKGIEINTELLSSKIGMPVVKTAAIYGLGLRELENVCRTAKPVAPSIAYPAFVGETIKELEAVISGRMDMAKGILFLLLSDPESGRDIVESRYSSLENRPTARSLLDSVEKKFRVISRITLRKAILNSREGWANQTVSLVVKRDTVKSPTVFDFFAEISRHPVWGWPILFGILWIIFEGVGKIAGWMAGFLDSILFIPAAEWVASLIANPLLKDFLVGDFGILTMGIANAIGTVVPILLVFFLLLNLLEDIGYLPNLSILLNRLLMPLGLSGKAVLPMVLGFGCNTMATLTTRMLESRRERILATFLIALGFPCAVQLGIMLAIMATAPYSVLLIVISAVMVTQIISGLILNSFVPVDKKADFIIELPRFRLPNMRNVARKTYFRLEWFLSEAVPMFMVAAVAMFTLKVTGLLRMIENALSPVVTGFLSLPEKMTEVFILVLSRREVGAVFFKDMVDGAEVDYYQTVVGLVVITLFIPCASNTIVMFKELGARWAIAMNVGIIVIAVLVGGFVDFIIRMF